MGHDWQGATWSGPFHSIDTITVTAVMTDNTTTLIIINSVLKLDNSYKPRVRELPGRDTALNLKFFKVFLLLNYLLYSVTILSYVELFYYLCWARKSQLLSRGFMCIRGFNYITCPIMMLLLLFYSKNRSSF